MKVLVTGGAGFIGSNFIRAFLKKHKGHSIINLDKLTYAGNLDNLKDIPHNSRYRFVRGDIADASLVSSLMKKVEAVIHFAAESHVDRSIRYPDEFIHTNLHGTNVLLKSAAHAGIRRFLHVSTDEVYGSVEKGYADEQAPLNPSSPYSSSKAGSDLLVLSYFRTFNLPVVVTRSANNFGPYQYPEKVLPVFITHALQHKPLPVYARGLNIRDWLYVEDNCEAIRKVFFKGRAGEIYNIGSHVYLRNIDLALKVLRILNKPSALIRYVTDRPGHDFRYAVSTKKIERELRWKPRNEFALKLNQTVAWYCRNRQWWEKGRK